MNASVLQKMAAELTQAGRERIKTKNFAIPRGDGPGDTGKYPIHDESHARAAIQMVDRHGTSGEKAQVYAAVAKKYPGLAARSSVPGVQKAREKDNCSGTKMAAMRQELERLKLASLVDRLGQMARPGTELGGHAWDVAGLGILAVPVADKLQAMARARLAGEQGGGAVERRQFISEPVAEGMELGGLGVLAAPSAVHLLRRGH